MKLQIPLKQHVGAPCKPIISLGEEVKRGMRIAEPNGLGAPIHASASGIVTTLNDQFIEIEALDLHEKDFQPIPETETMLQAIEEAGIVGAGGAGFPTHVKYRTTIVGGTVIANAAECEPLLGHNIRFLEEEPEKLIRGLRYLQEIVQAENTVIAIKPKHKKAAAILSKVIQDEPNMTLFYLPDMYPSGDERVIIREVLGVTLEPGQLPSAANAIVSNVETIKHAVEAIEDRKPFIEKDVTVGGRVKGGETVFLNQPIGLPVRELIKEAGGYIEPHGEIVIGGPFTGRSSTEDATITKTTGGILVAMPYPNEDRKVGILICECGGSKERLEEIAHNMGADVVAAERCKRMVEVDGRYRCGLPGICPGQAEKVLKMKKEGAEVILTGTCQD